MDHEWTHGNSRLCAAFSNIAFRDRQHKICPILLNIMPIIGWSWHFIYMSIIAKCNT